MKELFEQFERQAIDANHPISFSKSDGNRRYFYSITQSMFEGWLLHYRSSNGGNSSENSAVKEGQTRRGSLLESLVNILVGYSVNFTANLLIFPLFGWHISTRENLTLGVIYTGISLVRSYGLRRFFNHKDLKK